MWEKIFGIIIDMAWGALIFALIFLTVLFSTGTEANFLYANF